MIAAARSKRAQTGAGSACRDSTALQRRDGSPEVRGIGKRAAYGPGVQPAAAPAPVTAPAGAAPAPAAELCVRVPAAGRDVCPVCHGWRRPGFELCLSCQRVRRQLSNFCRLVAPVSLCVGEESRLYSVLTGYKSERASPYWRDARRQQLAALFETFLAAHGGCIAERAGTRWDAIATVPTSAGRLGPHPLASLVAGIPSLAGAHVEPLSRGHAALGHLVASDDGYRCCEPTGRRVLLLDDTFTSGARAQSAASALALGGATVVAIVPAGRMVRPAFGASAAFWARQRRRRFELDVCCLER